MKLTPESVIVLLLKKVKSDVKLTKRRQEALRLLIDEKLSDIYRFLKEEFTNIDNIHIWIDKDNNVWLMSNQRGTILGNLRYYVCKLRVIERNIPITNVDTPDRYTRVEKDAEIIEDEVVEDPFR